MTAASSAGEAGERAVTIQPVPTATSARLLLTKVGTYWLASLFGLLTTFARTSLTSRWLGPGGVAIVGQLSLVLVFAAVTSGLGLATAGTKAVAQSSRLQTEPETRSLAKSLIMLPCCIATVVCLACAVVAREIGTLLLGADPHSGLILLTLAAVPPTVAVSGMQAVMLGRGRVSDLARASVISAGLGCVAVVLATAAGGLDGAALSVPLTAVITLAVFLAHDPWIRSALRRARWASLGVVRSLAPLGSASLVASVFTASADVIVRAFLVHNRGLAEAGLYQPAYVLSSLVFAQLATSLGVVLLPTLAHDIAGGDNERARTSVNIGVAAGVTVATGVALVCLIFRGAGLDIAFGSAFVGSRASVGWQLTGEVPRVFCYTLGAVLLPMGRVRAWLCCGLCATALRLTAAGILVPGHGTVGLALSFTVEWSFIAALTFLLTRTTFARLDRDTCLICLVSLGAPLLALIVDSRTHVLSGLVAFAWLAAVATRLPLRRVVSAIRKA